ncbi:MAG: hypothetical protein ABUK01_16735 [Leptospirales bacterium]
MPIPDITTEWSEYDYNKDAQGAYENTTRITQDGKNLKIYTKSFDPFTKDAFEGEVEGEILAWNVSQAIAKLWVRKKYFQFFDTNTKRYVDSDSELAIHFLVEGFDVNKRDSLNVFAGLGSEVISHLQGKKIDLKFSDEPWKPTKLDYLFLKRTNEVEHFYFKGRYMNDTELDILKINLSPVTEPYHIEMGLHIIDEKPQGFIILYGLHHKKKELENIVTSVIGQTL